MHTLTIEDWEALGVSLERRGATTYINVAGDGWAVVDSDVFAQLLEAADYHAYSEMRLQKVLGKGVDFAALPSRQDLPYYERLGRRAFKLDNHSYAVQLGR